MTVQNTYYRDFALFCEALAYPQSASQLLLEDSTLLQSPVAKNVGGELLIKYLHRRGSLAHDQSYKAIRPRDITWSTIREHIVNSWVFFTGDQGTAAVRTGGPQKNDRLDYQVVIFTGDEDPENPVNHPNMGKKFTSSNEMLSFVKTHIGKVTGMYYGTDPASRREKKSKRSEYWKQETTPTVDRHILLMQFKPLIQKSVTAALANVKGHLVDNIKNDSFNNATALLLNAKNLKELLDHLDYFQHEYDISQSNLLSRSMDAALVFAASHYYPEQTGRIERRGYGYNKTYNPQNVAGIQKILQDISQGNKEKVGTILYYFKRALVT